ncbi:MAG: hypothetical protein N4A76_13110 [Firmicutes bacterium]|jgi:hypothetical protein|nr:hypothetical protein [Bacillota bacterium]
MKLSKYVCGLLISSILIGPTMAFAEDYLRIHTAYPSGDKIIFVENNKYGIKDRNFFTVVEPTFENIDLYEDGYAVSTYDGKKGILDPKGNIFINNKFDDIIPIENGNFLALNKELDSLKYIFINTSKEEYLMDSYMKSYSNGGKITDNFVGSLSDFNNVRSVNPSKSYDMHVINALLKDTNYYVIDDAQDKDFGQLKKIDAPELENSSIFRISYGTNLNPVIEVTGWGKSLKADKISESIIVENLTMETLKYFSGDMKISQAIFNDMDYFMKSQKKGFKQNKTYNNFFVTYEAIKNDGIRISIRK